MPTKYLAALVLLFSACAATKWVKQGSTMADFANDKQFCVLYAKNTNENYSAYRGLWTAKIFDECMQERGWTPE